jgi:lysophospholipase L1-like esterase
MNAKVRNLGKNLALALGSFLFCFLLLELVLRVAGFGNLEIYEPDPKFYWRLKPNQNCLTKVGRKPVHINSHGTRGPEFSVNKPPGVTRILFLGDSKTFGWGLSEDETYASLVKKGLEQRRPQTHVEVINAGVNAWSYHQMLAYFRERAKTFAPDYLVIGDANLWTQFSENSSPDFVRKFMNRVRLKNFFRRFATYHFVVEVALEDFYQKYRTKFIPVDPAQDTLFKEQQQRDPFGSFRAAIRGLCEEASANRVKPVLLYIPILTDIGTTNKTILEVKAQISKELNVPLVDMTPELEKKRQELYLEADPVHLNVSGNELTAQKLVEVLLSNQK